MFKISIINNYITIISIYHSAYFITVLSQISFMNGLLLNSYL